MRILVLLVVLSLTFTKAKALNCNVFSYQFERSRAAAQCVQIHKAVKKALLNDSVNMYVLDEAFTSPHHHLPATMIIHYKVQIIEAKGHSFAPRRIAFDGNEIAYHEGTYHIQYISEIIFNTQDRDIVIVCEEEDKCIISIGWSSVSVYTFIRPKFILSLQPAWFLCSLKFSIHEHFGFSREITLHINLQEDDLPVNTTADELQHPLEQITAKVTIIKLVYTV